MKTKYLILFSILFGFLASCKNSEEFNDVLYFSWTEESPTVKFTVEEPSSMGVSVRSSTTVSSDIKVNLRVDNSLLEKYNKETGKNCKLLPEVSYSLSKNFVVIEAGKYVSKPTLLSINSVDQFLDEDTYCVPITITNVEGTDMQVLESSRTMYVVVNKTIISNAVVLTNTYYSVDFESDPSRDLSNVPQVTMEARVFVNNYQNYDPYISTVMGLEENFLLRFGDVKIPKDYLQLAGGGYPVSSTGAVPANKWVHVAVTYDGAKISLYIDGKLNAYTAAPRGGINLIGIDPDRTFFIGRTMNGAPRPLDGAMTYARVWTRALTQSEIVNNMCAVSPDTPDLLAYWKFNAYKGEDSKNVILDVTGHGYDAVSSREAVFITGVRCP